MIRLGTWGIFLMDAISLRYARQLWRVLPDRVPSKFDVAGQPIHWMPREMFVELFVGTVLFLSAVFLLSSAVIGARGSQLKVPNREYWLSLERSDETVAWMRGWVGWFGTLALVMVTSATYLVATFALGDATAMGGKFMGLLLGFGVCTVALIVSMYVRFALPD